jgi:TM2 domain-containing membrane protein YozV
MYTTNTSDKNKAVALFLCVFLGFLGAHHFYVGRIGTGLLYACTFGFFMFGWAVDIVSIMLGCFRDNVGAPLRK